MLPGRGVGEATADTARLVELTFVLSCKELLPRLGRRAIYEGLSRGSLVLHERRN